MSSLDSLRSTGARRRPYFRSLSFTQRPTPFDFFGGFPPHSSSEDIRGRASPTQPTICWVLRDKASNQIVEFITEEAPTYNPALLKYKWCKVDPPISLPWILEVAQFERANHQASCASAASEPEEAEQGNRCVIG